MRSADIIRWLNFMSKGNLTSNDRVAVKGAMEKVKLLDDLEKELKLMPCDAEEYCGRKSCHGCKYHSVSINQILKFIRGKK